MTKNLVIVESPAKCKTIKKYLGSDYEVLASFGHIRDLPSKDGSVRPDDDFAMNYQISSGSKKHLSAITAAMKKADNLILATDPDREGEAISWHVLEALRANKSLKKTNNVQRIAFSSITKKAVNEAVENPRELDMNLVNAQQARRALDYLVGFNISPVLWRKLPGSKSAGRVQSVALRLICEREHEIEIFEPKEYWDIKAEFTNKSGEKYTANLTHFDNKKLGKFSLNNQKSAKDVEEALASGSYHIDNIEKKQSKRNPYAPFTTSTLQQEASRKLGFGAKRTMQVAQKLYEGMDVGDGVTGIITYMRTDGVTVAPDAIAQTRSHIKSVYGDKYLPEKQRFYSTKAKNAQEAHEAIRPTDPTRTPDSIKQYLSDEQYKLYALIWKRLIASQMENVILDQVAAIIKNDDGKTQFRATGSTINFDGFYRVYREDVDDKKEDDEGKILPPLSEGEKQNMQSALAQQHFTQPLPRFTEASLVKKMEELGIGRPSTYAAIISVLQDRQYVVVDKKRFVPEIRGRLVTAFLSSFFPHYVEYDFTAGLEDELDNISSGDLDWKTSLRNFWKDFSVSVEGAMSLEFEQVTDALNNSLEKLLFVGEGTIEERRKCPKDGGVMGLKTGKFGAFLGCSNYPECKHTVQLMVNEDNGAAQQDGEFETKILGKDEESGKDITLRKGPYGFYVQIGEVEDIPAKGKNKDGTAKTKKSKPKRASLAKDKTPDSLTLDDAILMLSLPRVVGNHPETGDEITASIGRFGPYLKYDGKFVSLKEDDVYTVGINRAVTVIAEGAKGGRAKAEPLRVVGTHPDGGDVAIYDGRYGPYVKYGKINATIGKKFDKDKLTIDEAIALIAAKKK